MRRRSLLLIALGCAALFGAAWTMGGRTVIDYGLTCSKCLEDHYIVEKKFLGVTYSTRKSLRSDPSDYRDLMGHECQHAFHRGGFGKTKYVLGGSWIGCGKTAEGIFFRERNQAIRRTFELADSLQDPQSARRTIKLVDSLVPPDTDWKVAQRAMDEPRAKLLLLLEIMEKISSAESWRKVLSNIENGTLVDFEKAYGEQTGNR